MSRTPLKLIDNRLDEQTLANHLNGLLAEAEEGWIHVAYLRESGVAPVRDAVADFVRRGGGLRGRGMGEGDRRAGGGAVWAARRGREEQVKPR